MTWVGTAIAAVTAVVGGMQQKAASERQENQVEASALMQGKETARVAAEQASQASQASESDRRKQKIQYLKSGVSLEGSPFLMMEATRLQGVDNVNEITTSGGYGVASAMSQGAMASDNYRTAGRNALISGITSAGSSAYKAKGTMGGSSSSQFSNLKKSDIKWNS